MSQRTPLSNHIERIAIVGAGGQVGKYIVDALLEKNIFQVTALTRKDSTKKPAPNIKSVTVDYDDPSTLVSALKGQDALIITMSVAAPPTTQATLIKAAAEAGVPWVLPNEFGFDTADEQIGNDLKVGPAKKADRDLIESLGVSKWVGIVSLFWYEYSLSGPGLYGIDIPNKEVVFFDGGNTKIHTTTWPQSGRAVAAVLALPIRPEDGGDKSITLSSYANRMVYINSFTLTQREMFDSVKRVTNTTDSDYTISTVDARERHDEKQKRMAQGDMLSFAHAMYTRMFFADGAGVYNGKELQNEKLGLPKEDLDEFTKIGVKMAEEGYLEKMFKKTDESKA